jgi:Trypsin-co-occurring domain 2
MDTPEDDLSIRTLIRAVTKELVESQQERLAAGEAAIFEVSDLTLEISFVATSSKHGGGGFDLKVVKADAGMQYDEQSVHKITLSLKAVADQPFNDGGAFRPRRVGSES